VPVSRTPIIAREGWVHIAVALAAAVAVSWFASLAWAIPLWLVVLFVLQFFRDPPRQIPDQAGAVICPADGRIVQVSTVHDPWLDREALQISIFMNVFSVHVNRAPVPGRIQERWYRRGGFVNAALDKASAENERNALWIRTEGAHDVVCVQVAGLVARRILCYVNPGDGVEAGQRYGFIRFGSRVDVLLPPDSRARARLGDWVSGGSDIIADLPPAS